jgi:queuine/archaeosine tRNA-ribosyltransferase
MLSLHYLRFLVRLGEQARTAIRAGEFEAWSTDWLSRWRGGTRAREAAAKGT